QQRNNGQHVQRQHRIRQRGRASRGTRQNQRQHIQWQSRRLGGRPLHHVGRSERPARAQQHVRAESQRRGRRRHPDRIGRGQSVQRHYRRQQRQRRPNRIR